MKLKVITSIILLCSILSLFYAMLNINIISLSKPYSLFNIGKIDLSPSMQKTSWENESVKVQRVIAGSKEITHDDFFKKQFGEHFNYDNVTPLNTKGELRFLSNKTYTSSLESVIVNVSNTESTIKIGILIPSSTRKLTNPVLEHLTLINICLPSIYSTVETEFEYGIYIGIDKGDYLETVIEKLEKYDKVIVVVNPGRTFTKSVNAMARKAYNDGMDYLVRINDDSSFETINWTSQGINVLNNYTPINIGVVGPTCHEGNTAILTHDMVHRTHLEIFDFYYPPYFDNWWADDWITIVYSPNRSTKLSTWIVKHHWESYASRYNVNFNHETRLEKMLAFDAERLNEYIDQTYNQKSSES